MRPCRVHCGGGLRLGLGRVLPRIIALLHFLGLQSRDNARAQINESDVAHALSTPTVKSLLAVSQNITQKELL